MSVLSIAIGFHSPLPMVVYTVPFTPSLHRINPCFWALTYGTLPAEFCPWLDRIPGQSPIQMSFRRIR